MPQIRAGAWSRPHPGSKPPTQFYKNHDPRPHTVKDTPTTATGLAAFSSLVLDLANLVPSELGDLANLVGLDLHDNRISGPIPLALGNIKSLKLLNLSSNDLCGKIPTAGAFKGIPASSFAHNPRLHQGGNYEPNC